jgi:hypothetical protein
MALTRSGGVKRPCWTARPCAGRGLSLIYSIIRLIVFFSSAFPPLSDISTYFVTLVTSLLRGPSISFGHIDTILNVGPQWATTSIRRRRSISSVGGMPRIQLGTPAMIGAVQTFGDLVHWHSRVHTIVAEGVFKPSGHFVHIPDIWLHRAIEIWQEKVFALLLDMGKIDPDVVSNMRDVDR